MKNRYVLLAELPLFVIAAFGAFAARFDWEFYQRRPEFLIYALAALAIKPVVFWLFGMYRRYWQYTGIHDRRVVLVWVSPASFCMAWFVAAVHGTLIAEFSRLVLFNDWLMTLATASGLRVAIRVAHESAVWSTRGTPSGAAKRMLIVGAGAAGTMV